MLCECGDQVSGAIQIATQLRAAELMREGMYAIHAAGKARVRETRDSLSSATDTANRAQDPNFVARTDATIRSTIAKEGLGWSIGRSWLHGAGIEPIGIESREQRLNIVRVDVGACCNRSRSASNRKAVLQDRLTGRDLMDRELVTAADWLQQCDRDIANRDLFAGLQIAHGDGDVVLGRNPQCRGRVQGGHASSGQQSLTLDGPQ
jgi:hypothetical protein